MIRIAEASDVKKDNRRLSIIPIGYPLRQGYTNVIYCRQYIVADCRNIACNILQTIVSQYATVYVFHLVQSDWLDSSSNRILWNIV